MILKDVFTPAAIAAYWNEAGSNRADYLGAALFPSKKKAGLDLAWLKGNKGVPISLMPSTFDAKATFRDRIGVEKIETEMPFFREGYKLKEKDRQEILRAQGSGDPYAAAVIERVFDDAGDLIAAADVVPERMRMQLLFPASGTPGIAIKANGVDYTYNYDPSGTWATTNYTALTGNALWTAPSTADPFAAFRAAKNAVGSATGADLTVAVMNGYTFDLMCQIQAVKNRYLSTSGIALGYLSDDEVKNAIKRTNNLDVIVYDKKYRDEDGTARSFVPDGYVALLPAGALGSTWYGTTPEEADLMGVPTADVQIVNTGVAITRVVEEHPVNVNIFASEIVLPSFERMSEVAVLKVIA